MPTDEEYAELEGQLEEAASMVNEFTGKEVSITY